MASASTAPADMPGSAAAMPIACSFVLRGTRTIPVDLMNGKVCHRRTTSRECAYAHHGLRRTDLDPLDRVGPKR